MHFTEMKNRDQLYTFVDNKGVNTHIDSGGLREWCINSPTLEVFNVPINKRQALNMIRDNTVSPGRVLEVMRKKFDPIIMAKDGTYSPTNGGPNVLLVDGHHRYFAAYMCRLNYIPSYLLEVEQWEPFKVEGIPALTQEQLRRIPLTKRDY